MRQTLLALLLLTACGDDSGTGSAGTGGADSTSPAVGSGGAPGSGGGDAGAGGPTSATSSAASGTSSAGTSTTDAAATASASEASASASTGAGGDGGGECAVPECADAARVRCNPECDAGFDCDDDVCAGASAWTLALGDALVQLPPVVVAYDACEPCGDDVLWSLVIPLPDVDEGCVVAEAPPGVTWDVSGGACPAEQLGCERAPFDGGQSIHIIVTDPSDFPRDVLVHVTEDANCVGVPEPTCSGLGCFGAG